MKGSLSKMILIAYLILITQIFLSKTEPIDQGDDVGEVKIHNGKKIIFNPGEFGYLAHLEILTLLEGNTPNKVTMVHGTCGGVLIKKDIILTAAHCIEYPENKKKITAWLGVLDTKLEQGAGQEIPVRGYTIHGAFIRSDDNLNLNYVNDIALLFLQRPAVVDGKLVKLVKLPIENFEAAYKQGWIVGWGTGLCGKHKTMLQKAQVRGVSSSDCQRYYKTTKIPFTFICVLSKNKRATTTHGDSGGPFVIDDTIVGISSFGAIKSDPKNGKIVCDAKKPAVYTYVPIYIKWIERNSKLGPEILIIRPEKPTPKPSVPARRISVP